MFCGSYGDLPLCIFSDTFHVFFSTWNKNKESIMSGKWKWARRQNVEWELPFFDTKKIGKNAFSTHFTDIFYLISCIFFSHNAAQSKEQFQTHSNITRSTVWYNFENTKHVVFQNILAHIRNFTAKRRLFCFIVLVSTSNTKNNEHQSQLLVLIIYCCIQLRTRFFS